MIPETHGLIIAKQEQLRFVVPVQYEQGFILELRIENKHTQVIGRDLDPRSKSIQDPHYPFIQYQIYYNKANMARPPAIPAPMPATFCASPAFFVTAADELDDFAVEVIEAADFDDVIVAFDAPVVAATFAEEVAVDPEVEVQVAEAGRLVTPLALQISWANWTAVA